MVELFVYLTVFVLACKRAPTVYTVAMKYTLVHVLVEVFVAFFHSYTWIPFRVAKEVQCEQA